MKRNFALGSLLLAIATSCSIATGTVLAQTSTEQLSPYANQAENTTAGFNPNAILDDRDLFDVQAMNFEQLKEFLMSKGTLGTLRTKDIDGVEKWASQIIWRVANAYKINPRYLLALMQKEQSLVEDPNPTQKQLDWATGFGVCDDCSMNDPSLQEFKGFASQLEWAAKQHREKYLLQILGRGTTIAGYAPGKPTTIDGVRVTPVNRATAMLYSYTPHLHGNENLWSIWQRWFALLFPEGTVVRARTSKQAYLLRFGEKRPFKSMAALASMIDPKKIVAVDDSQIAAYPTGKTIPFANYALVQTPNGKRYLIVGNTKRLIMSRKVFQKAGFNEDEVVDGTASDLDAYEDGPDITLTTSYPAGLLAKDSAKQYWYIENSIRHLISSKTLLSLYFKGQPAMLLSQKKLEAFSIGDPYRLHDGELVQAPTDPAVFVIENGMRRPIPSAQIFEELGWNWKNVAVLPASLLQDYALADPVDPHAIHTIVATDDTSY